MNHRDEQFDLDPELISLDAQLSDLLHVDAPAHLNERILTATAGSLDQRLRQALAVTAPADLPQRVFDVTVDHLPGVSVVGRVGFGRSTGWLRIAVAAAIAIVAGWVMIVPQLQSTDHATSSVARSSLEERVRRVEVAMATRSPDSIETQVAALTLDVEQAAWNVRVEPTSDMFQPSTDVLSDQIDALEAEIGRF
jgi:hypothetical protein